MSRPRPLQACRFVLFAGLALAAVLVSAGSAVAQPVVPDPAAVRFQGCMNPSAVAQVAAGPQAAVPDTQPYYDPEAFMEQAWSCTLDFAELELVPFSQGLLGVIAIIMFVWYGIQQMTGRGFNLAGLLNHVLLLGFAVMVLQNYSTPQIALFPTDTGFVRVIGSQAISWSQDIHADVEEAFERTYAEAKAALDATARQVELQSAEDAADPESSPEEPPVGAGWFSGWFDGWFKGAFSSWFDGIINWVRAQVLKGFVGTIFVIVSVFLWLLRWYLEAQYMWGYFILMALSVVGPVLVPALLIPQIDWLFWNWVRGLFTACLYILTASAIYAISMVLLTSPLMHVVHLASEQALIGDALVGLGVTLVSLLTLFFMYLPILLLVIIMSTQAGALSAVLLSGSGPTSMAMARQVISRGAAGIAAVTAGSSVVGAQRGAKALRFLGAGTLASATMWTGSKVAAGAAGVAAAGAAAAGTAEAGRAATLAAGEAAKLAPRAAPAPAPGIVSPLAVAGAYANVAAAGARAGHQAGVLMGPPQQALAPWARAANSAHLAASLRWRGK